MRTVGYYLKENWKPVAVYAGMAAVFWTVGSLYGVDPDATGYALLLAGKAVATPDLFTQKPVYAVKVS